MTMKLFSSILFVVLFFMDNNSVQCYRPFHIIEMFLNESKTAFSTFKRDFRVSYHSVEEEARRFLIFAENYFYVALNNKHYNQGKVSYKMGINEFSDKKDHELKALRGFKPTLLKHPKSHIASFHMRSAVNQTLPQSVDWRELGAVTGVKNQGHCGSCWAFSTTGSLEGQHFRKSGKLVSLSEQQLVDCSAEYGNNGCNGGLMDNAFSYIKDNGGIDTEQAYPYISGNTSKQEKTCNYRKNFIGAKDTGFVDIKSGNEEALKEALANVGPISVAIDASQPGFMGYREGVYTDDMCQNGPMNLDHGVLLVGYGVDKSEEGDDVEYWLVKNSWGHLWGLQGYIKMRRGYNNMCGIATTASYPLV